MKFNSAYSDKSRVQVFFPEPSLTKQSMKDECDINLILAKYQRTGIIDFAAKQEPRYGDASAVDFQQALNVVIRANEMFAELPSSMRKRFQNSPEEFMAFVDDPENVEESIRLGIRTAPVVSPAASETVLEVVPPA